MALRTHCTEGRRCPYCGNIEHVEAADYSESVRETECEKCERQYITYEDFTVTHVSVAKERGV